MTSSEATQDTTTGLRLVLLVALASFFAKALVLLGLLGGEPLGRGVFLASISAFGADATVLLWLAFTGWVIGRLVPGSTARRVEWGLGFVLGLYTIANVFMVLEVGRPFHVGMLSVATGTDEAVTMMESRAARIAIGGLLAYAVLAVPLVNAAVRVFADRTRVFYGLVAVGLYGGSALLYVQANPFLAAKFGLHRSALTELALGFVTPMMHDVQPSGPPVVDRAYAIPTGEGWIDPVHIEPGPKPKHVVVWLAESTGARYTSLYHKKSDTTPNLMALSEHGLAFQRYYANVPLSSKSIFGVLCGMYPYPDAKPIQKVQPRIACPSLMETLTARGYRAGLFTGALFGYGDKQKFLSDRGFDIMADGETVRNVDKYWRNGWGVDDAAIVDHALSWLDEAPDSGQPQLLVMIPIIPHVPYGLPPRAKRGKDKSRKGRYLDSIRYADEQFGRFYQGLVDRGLAEDTLVVYLGDHGEAFGQHPGNKNHGGFIYEENIHVPLVLINPRLFPERQWTKRLGSHVDLQATIFDLLDQAQPGGGQGQSLVAHDYIYRPAFMGAYVRDHLGGFRDGNWKYIYNFETSTDEVYNLDADDGEQTNVAEEIEPELLATWRRWVMEYELRQRTFIEGHPTKGETYLSRVERAMKVSLVDGDDRVECRDSGPEGHGVSCPLEPPFMTVALTHQRIKGTTRECLAVHPPENGKMVIEIPHIDPLPAFVGAGLTAAGREAGGTPLDVTWYIENHASIPMRLEDDKEDSFEASLVEYSGSPGSGSVRIEVRSDNWDNRSGCVILSP